MRPSLELVGLWVGFLRTFSCKNVGSNWESAHSAGTFKSVKIVNSKLQHQWRWDAKCFCMRGRRGDSLPLVMIQLGPLHTRDWEPVTSKYTSSTLIGGKGWSRSKFATSHYTWGTTWVCECKMDVKSTWIPAWHQMDHVAWSLGLCSKIVSWR